jgi:hypothetical protein
MEAKHVDEPSAGGNRREHRCDAEERHDDDHREVPPRTGGRAEILLEEDALADRGAHSGAYGTLSTTARRPQELAMKKLIILLILVALGVAVSKKLREA